MAHHHLTPLLKVIFIFGVATGVISQGNRKFTIVNNCQETIWPGIVTQRQGQSFNGSGFSLKPRQSVVYTSSDGRSGRIWGRTGCNFDQNGTGKCKTGSCSTSVSCSGPGAPPATIVEFTLAATIDYYDVSLVGGFNLPIVVTPLYGKGGCSNAGCDGDLRQNCPADLAVKSDGKVIGCNSACDKYESDEYCCRGAYGTPAACQPSNYSKIFKSACPAAYSYPFDANTSIRTCTGAEYVVSFCATRNGTACSYNNSSLACSGSHGLRAAFHEGWLLVIAMPMMSGIHHLLGFIM